MDAKVFLKGIRSLGVDRYYGVPDSQLKAFCDLLFCEYGIGKEHIVAANEGGAVGLAAGHYLATGKPALVYMQNSGIGNAFNPIASLLNGAVYGIPCIFVIGWRGEPGTKDEPQHVFMGKITLPTLELLDIDCFIISNETSDEEFGQFIRQAAANVGLGRSSAFIIRKGALTSQSKAIYKNNNLILRETAIRVVVENADDTDVFVSTTGKASRELFEIREALRQGHERDFLTVGSMGHASMIALGIAMAKREKRIWCIDGDGAMVMHLGNALVACRQKCGNLVHVVLNNGAHETVGGMPVASGDADFCAIAKTFGYEFYRRVTDESGLERCIGEVKAQNRFSLIEVMVSLGARDDLGRPTTTAMENKNAFMACLSGVKEL
jgi:phosphonopyruvate decarboxylase